MAKKTLYEILEIPPDANEMDINLAYQKRGFELKREDPPDPNRLAIVKQAYDVLSDPKRRAAYDASLTTASERAAAAGQAAPDLVIEDGDEDTPHTKRNILLLAGMGVLLLVIILWVVRYSRSPEPPSKVAAEPMTEAAKPEPPPPPPKPLTAEQILPTALASVGTVMSYEMSGRAVPVGLAVAIEPNAVITTCHAIPAGSQLVVKMGAEMLSANLSITDEELDLCKLAISGPGVRALGIATDEAKTGDKIFTIGANAKGELALTEGTVKQLRMAPAVKVLEVSMPIAPNGSGGAVVDVYGRLVGIATTPHRFGPNIHAAISSAWISQMRSRGRPQQ